MTDRARTAASPYAEQAVDGMMLARGLDPAADRPYLARNWDRYAAVLAERVVQGCCRACGGRFARLHVGRPKPDGSRRPDPAPADTATGSFR